ncbi:MAG: type II toxin-antitoxin system RelE/ParE family toxin [Saprospiraceae bacterium]
MSYSVIVLRKAQSDVLNARAWYEDESPGLGERFSEALIASFLRIAKHPTRYTPIGKEARIAPVRRFPYRVFYTTNEAMKRVEIVAVIHNKRHPRVWKRRL